jgi:hypothetical protein
MHRLAAQTTRAIDDAADNWQGARMAQRKVTDLLVRVESHRGLCAPCRVGVYTLASGVVQLVELHSTRS